MIQKEQGKVCGFHHSRAFLGAKFQNERGQLHVLVLILKGVCGKKNKDFKIEIKAKLNRQYFFILRCGGKLSC